MIKLSAAALHAMEAHEIRAHAVEYVKQSHTDEYVQQLAWIIADRTGEDDRDVLDGIRRDAITVQDLFADLDRMKGRDR